MTPQSTHAFRQDLPLPPPVPLGDIALYLDFDGTLVDLAPRPEAVRVPIAVHRRLRRIRHDLNDRLVVVSGRPLSQINRYLGSAARLAAGLHGAERQGTGEAGADLRKALGAIRRLRPWIRRQARGLDMECKATGVALHYRRRPRLKDHAVRLARRAATLSHGILVVQQGHAVVELRPAGIHKGLAVRDFQSRPAFWGTIPVFVGDDLTDEEGFAAATALGGFGVVVGARRPTLARYALPDVPAVHAWLDALGEERTRP